MLWKKSRLLVLVTSDKSVFGMGLNFGSPWIKISSAGFSDMYTQGASAFLSGLAGFSAFCTSAQFSSGGIFSNSFGNFPVTFQGPWRLLALSHCDEFKR